MVTHLSRQSKSPEHEDSLRQQRSPWQQDSLQKQQLLAIGLIVAIVTVVVVLTLCLYRYWWKHWRRSSAVSKGGEETIHVGNDNDSVITGGEKKKKKLKKTSSKPDETGDKSSDQFLQPHKNDNLNSSNSISSTSPDLGQMFMNIIGPFQLKYQEVCCIIHYFSNERWGGKFNFTYFEQKDSISKLV